MRIVCIGDSLTYGYGVQREKCWIDILRKELNVIVLNKGVNGDTLAGILSRSFRDVVENKPDIVVIMAGTNDFLMDSDLERVQGSVDVLIQEARQFHIMPIIGIQISVEKTLAIKKWSKEVKYDIVNRKIEKYRDWVINYCEKHNILYVDFYKTFAEASQIMAANELYIDGVHPTELGHEIMAECIIEIIRKVNVL